MKLSRQELKYQARQQLAAKFVSQSIDWWNRCVTTIDIEPLLKKVVK